VHDWQAVFGEGVGAESEWVVVSYAESREHVDLPTG
jgi:hypothetical protein